jgi:hypothetical protein
MDFPAQPPFRPDAHAVSDDRHPHHQFWIDRGTANLAVERPQLRAHALEVEELIDAPKQVVAGQHHSRGVVLQVVKGREGSFSVPGGQKR